MWRFATWNLDFRQRNPEQVPRYSLIEKLGASVVALQEVSGPVAKALRAAHPGESIFSQEIYPPANWRWMGCALLLKEGSEVLDQGVLETLPKPQRALWALVKLRDMDPMTFVSWHTPNAAGDGRETKMAAYAAMSTWLARVPRPLVLGADLNTWTDPVDLLPADPNDPFREESAFMGPEPQHKLIDAYRSVLAADKKLDALRLSRPRGPLATSYILKGGAEHRMDRIFASSELSAKTAAYDLAAGINSGSDHAIHWVDFF